MWLRLSPAHLTFFFLNARVNRKRISKIRTNESVTSVLHQHREKVTLLVSFPCLHVWSPTQLNFFQRSSSCVSWRISDLLPIWASHLHPRCRIQCKPTCSKQKKQKKKGGGGGEEGEKEREPDRTKLGVGRKWTQCLLCVWRKGLGTNTGRSVRVSCAAPCSMPVSSILSLSSHGAHWHWESTHSNTWPLERLWDNVGQDRTGQLGTHTGDCPQPRNSSCDYNHSFPPSTPMWSCGTWTLSTKLEVRHKTCPGRVSPWHWTLCLHPIQHYWHILVY